MCAKKLKLFVFVAVVDLCLAFDWRDGGTWAMDCDLPGQDMDKISMRGEDCGGKCASTSGCTHFAWRDWNGGTCFLKQGARQKSDAIWVQGAVCGFPNGDNAPAPGPAPGPGPAPSGGSGEGCNGGLSSEERNYIVDYHNRVRREVSPPAREMKTMSWSDEAAAIAQRYAGQCRFEHSSGDSRKINGKGLGENLSSSTGDGCKWETPMKGWADEKEKYTYPGGFSMATGHYTQMIWSDSTQVGCSYKRCPAGSNPMGSHWGEWNFYVCNYFPSGNWQGQPPYKT